MFIAALFPTAKTWKQPKYSSTEKWIKKMWHIYTMEYYSAIKKNEIISFAATWMDLEIIILSEVTQTEKDKLYYITYMWNLKKMIKMDFLQDKNRLIDIKNKFMVKQTCYQRGKDIGGHIN